MYLSLIKLLGIFVCDVILGGEAIPAREGIATSEGISSCEGPQFDVKLEVTDSPINELLKTLDVTKRGGLATFLGNSGGYSNIFLKVDSSYRYFATYYGTIAIGSGGEVNRFNVLFDTGSSEIWIPSDLCSSEQCLSKNRFHRNPLWQQRLDGSGNPIPVHIKYLTGEITALDGVTTVNLMNGLVLRDVDVGLATSVSVPMLEKQKWDGILGLGFKNRDMEKRGASPLLETIQRSKSLYPNYRNQFAYYISPTGGAITFGGLNYKYMQDRNAVIRWAPVIEGSDYWAIRLKRVELGGDTLYDSEGEARVSRAIIDTGTFLIYVPQSMGRLVSMLDVSSCKERERLPSIFLTFGGAAEDVRVELTGGDYLQEYGGRCAPGIAEEDRGEDVGFDTW